MAGVLYHRIKHGEDVTRGMLYRLLFNSGLVGLSLLVVLVACLLFMSQTGR
jgi:hypothetical protein